MGSFIHKSPDMWRVKMVNVYHGREILSLKWQTRVILLLGVSKGNVFKEDLHFFQKCLSQVKVPIYKENNVYLLTA